MTAESLVARSGDDTADLPLPRRARSTRDKLLDAAVDMTMDDGWASVTMSRLASKVGVSRQTVYNDVGTRAALAEAMITREVELFLSSVTTSFDGEEDLLRGVHTSVQTVLEQAHENRMLHAIISATHDADTEFLPLLTSRSKGLLEFAVTLVQENVQRYDHGLTDAELGVGVELIVRAVLSHIMHPSKSPEETADDIRWLTARVLQMDPGVG